MVLGKHFSSSAHSGRLLPHHHTSYLGITAVMAVFALLLMMITSNFRAQALTESGSISLSGTVYGPPPTIPATILSPDNGDSFSLSTIVVSGSCGPSLLVKIWRNSVLAGSTVCALDGTFSLQISLVSGANVLRARNYDFQDQAGPDSPDVTVDYIATQPSGSSSSGVPSSQASSSSLTVTSSYAYQSVTSNANSEWSFVIQGGQPPFAVLIDWGDGETSLISVKDLGSFSAKHIYRRSGTYKIRLKVTDAAGNQAFYEVVALSNGTKALPQVTQKPRFYDQIWPLLLTWPLYILLTLLVASFWLGEKYYEHKLFHHLRQQNT